MAVSSEFGEYFLSAARKGNVCLLQSLSLKFENGEGPGKVLYAELKTPEGKNALHLAAGRGTPEACTFLIEILGFDINATSSDRGETPLFDAIIEWNLPTAICLINRGADITKCNIFGDTLLHCAASCGFKEIAKLLISKGADVNATSQRGTPLCFAASSGHYDVLKYLLELKANVNTNPNSLSESTPLCNAMQAKPKAHLECMELLLKAGANPNHLFYGSTPLCLASTAEDEDSVRCLLKAGADPNKLDFMGYTPLDHAALNGHRKMAEILFPVTSRIACYPDWSIQGVMQHAKSFESMLLFMTKYKDFAPFAKRNGGQAFRRRNYVDAHNWFCVALLADQNDAKVLSNRSLCSVKMNEGEAALKDAQACIKLEPGWGKAHYREGVAWTVLKDFKKAAESFSRALALDPGSEEIKKAYREVQAELN